jgi:polysaccharide chain length determinant protein (PEP-CTERM system associated)
MTPDKPTTSQTQRPVEETISWALSVCMKGRWLIVLSTLVAVVGVNAVLRRIPPRFRSEATILILGQQISANFVAPVSDAPAEERLQVVTREVLSEPRLLEVVHEFGLFPPDMPPDDAVDQFRKRIDISPAGISTFQIAFTANTPELAQRVTNRLTDLFIQQSVEFKASQVRNATSLIQGELAERKKRLDELDQRIEAFRRQYAKELPQAPNQGVDRLNMASSRLDTDTSNRDRANAQRVVLESTLIGTLNARLSHLREERTALLRNFTSKHPDVVAKDQLISQMEAEIEVIKTGGTAGLNKSTLLAGDPTIAQLEGQLEANKLEVEILTKDIERQTAILAGAEQHENVIREQQLDAMTRERGDLAAEVSDLSRKEQQTNLAADMERREQPEQFRLVDPPMLPTHPAGKKLQAASLGALAGGPLVGLVFAFLLDFRKPTFRNENELRRAFSPPLVVSIPLLPTPKEQRNRRWLTVLESVAVCIMVVAIAAVQRYSYRLLG